MKPIAILGSGPAGLLAAYAVGVAGYPVVIFSEGIQSTLGGAQFLHKSIPGLTDERPDAMVTYKLEGTEEVYRQKVYGSRPIPFTSWQHLEDGMTQEAWSLIKLYDRLWDEFRGAMNVEKIGPQWLDDNADRFAMVISAIPAPALCRSANGLDMKGHQFYSVDVRIMNSCIWPVLDSTIVYDGTRDHSWYRCSQLFGHGGTEWGGEVSPPMPTRMFSKPLRHNCDCYPDVIRVGRFGRWQKGVLSHDGFLATVAAMKRAEML